MRKWMNDLKFKYDFKKIFKFSLNIDWGNNININIKCKKSILEYRNITSGIFVH